MLRGVYKYSFWTLNPNNTISSVTNKAPPPYIFVHYCDNEPTYDFREFTFWTEFETDSSEAASRGTGITLAQAKWRAVIALTDRQAQQIMEVGNVRWGKDHPPVCEYQSKIVIPNSMCTVTQLMLP